MNEPPLKLAPICTTSFITIPVAVTDDVPAAVPVIVICNDVSLRTTVTSKLPDTPFPAAAVPVVDNKVVLTPLTKLVIFTKICVYAYQAQFNEILPVDVWNKTLPVWNPPAPII